MSGTPLFDSVRAELLPVYNAAHSSGRIQERQDILKVLRKITRPGKQVEMLIKKLEETQIGKL